MNKLKKILYTTALLISKLTFGYDASHAQIQAKNETSKEFQIGVLREDGALLPFAEYRHGLWWNPWPNSEPVDEYNWKNPKTLTNHTKPWFQQCNGNASAWYFWSSVDTRTVINSRKLIEVDNHSDKNWALMTDYRNNTKTENDSHHKNIGFALNVDLKLETMIDIEKVTREASDIRAYIKSAFVNLETAEIGRIAATPDLETSYAKRNLPFSSEDRAKVELELTQISRSRSTINGRHIYYFEVEKKYPRPEGQADWQCYNVSSLNGWMLKEKDGSLRIINEDFGISDCDRKDGSSNVQMFNVLRFNERTYVFTVEHGWEDESYMIYELTEYGLDRILETSGG